MARGTYERTPLTRTRTKHSWAVRRLENIDRLRATVERERDRLAQEIEQLEKAENE